MCFNKRFGCVDHGSELGKKIKMLLFADVHIFKGMQPLKSSVMGLTKVVPTPHMAYFFYTGITVRKHNISTTICNKFRDHHRQYTGPGDS